MKGQCLETLVDLHETTEYRVKGREGMSEGWMPAMGLREGCPTSPILFSIYHQAVMRQALEARGAEGREEKSVVYESTVCCLRTIRLWWERKGRWMKV